MFVPPELAPAVRFDAEEVGRRGIVRHREVGAEKPAAGVVPELARMVGVGTRPDAVRVADRARVVLVGVTKVAGPFGCGRRREARVQIGGHGGAPDMAGTGSGDPAATGAAGAPVASALSSGEGDGFGGSVGRPCGSGFGRTGPGV